MSLFCRHQWVEQARSVRQPASEFKFGGGFWSETYDDLVYGCTLIQLRCENCGKVKTTKLSGAHSVVAKNRREK